MLDVLSNLCLLLHNGPFTDNYDIRLFDLAYDTVRLCNLRCSENLTKTSHEIIIPKGSIKEEIAQYNHSKINK